MRSSNETPFVDREPESQLAANRLKLLRIIVYLQFAWICFWSLSTAGYLPRSLIERFCEVRFFSDLFIIGTFFILPIVVLVIAHRAKFDEIRFFSLVCLELVLTCAYAFALLPAVQ